MCVATVIYGLKAGYCDAGDVSGGCFCHQPNPAPRPLWKTNSSRLGRLRQEETRPVTLNVTLSHTLPHIAKETAHTHTHVRQETHTLTQPWISEIKAKSMISLSFPKPKLRYCVLNFRKDARQPELWLFSYTLKCFCCCFLNKIHRPEQVKFINEFTKNRPKLKRKSDHVASFHPVTTLEDDAVTCWSRKMNCHFLLPG